jgi:phosphate transport system ATP-binding protein
MFRCLAPVLLALAASFSALTSAAERLMLTGSSTVAPLALEIAKRFERQHPDVRIDVQTGGSTRGVLDTRNGLADIGMIFQKPNPFPLSIRRNLELPLREHGVRDRRALNEKVEWALTSVGLWDEVRDRLEGSALALSGGQQQRLCIARALVLEPEILLMDEPCSALDPLSSAVVEDLIIRLRGRYTVVIVTHNLAQARRVANYAAFFWMTQRVGKLIEFGQCQRLFETPVHALTAAYISGARG